MSKKKKILFIAGVIAAVPAVIIGAFFGIVFLYMHLILEYQRPVDTYLRRVGTGVLYDSLRMVTGYCRVTTKNHF